MQINADFSRRAVVHGAQLEWLASPMAGVHRRMLDRIGGELARATSIVRYAPGSHFSPHVHSGGEEFLVIDGVFQDEHGDFPAGSYIRNPPQSRHTPGSKPGCVILVKLWQFDPADRTHVRTHIDRIGCLPDSKRLGVLVTPLYEDAFECVSIERWAPHTQVTVDSKGGAELFVLEGGFREQGEQFDLLSWLRVPVGESIHVISGAQGARVWLKTGHLRTLRAPGG